MALEAVLLPSAFVEESGASFGRNQIEGRNFVLVVMLFGLVLSFFFVFLDGDDE